MGLVEHTGRENILGVIEEFFALISIKFELLYEISQTFC